MTRILSNFVVVEVEGKQFKRGLPAADVAQALIKLVHPIKLRRIGGEVLALDDDNATSPVHRFRNDTGLFGWLAAQHVAVNWATRSAGCLPRADFYAALAVMIPEIVGVRDLPHVPPIPGVYYVGCGDFGRKYSGALDELVSFWLPHTEHDRSLMKAAFCTPFWGGRPGGRPAISIESDGRDNGRGVGKSQLLYAIAKVAGGHIDCRLTEDMDQIKKRLLTEGVRSNVVAFDNCKAAKVSSGDLEGLITAPMISGWRLFTGNAAVPNHLTYVFSMNDANFSADMSSRSVRIILSRSAVEGTWEARLDELIEKRRMDIIGDCIWLLKQDEKSFPTYIRFSSWQKGVLSKIDDSANIAEVLTSRQVAVDADAEFAADLRGAIQASMVDHLKPVEGAFPGTKNLNPEKDVVLIVRSVMADWVRSRLDRQSSDTAITKMIQRAKIDALSGETVTRLGSRYWCWNPHGSMPLRGAWRIDISDKKVPAKWHEFESKAGADVIELHQVSAPKKV